MTLLQSPQKRFVFAMVIFMFIGDVSYAKTYTLNGRVLNTEGDKVKGATLSLFSDGDLITEQETGGNGKFKFKKIDQGNYVIQASHSEFGSKEVVVDLTENKDVGNITLSIEKPDPPNSKESLVSGNQAPIQPRQVSVTVPQTMQAMGSPSKDFILNELNFEIKKFVIFLDYFSILILNYFLSPLIAFTVYFCFLHSIRHSISLAIELDPNSVANGFGLFAKKALPLTILTGVFSFIALYLLTNSYNLDSAILKVIFIGLASLTFPHILLEYFLEKNEK